MKNKRRFVAVMTLLVMIFLFGTVVSSSTFTPPNSTSDISALELNSTIGEIVRNIVRFIFLIAGVVLAGIGAWHFLVLATSSRNPQARAESSMAIKWYLIGAAGCFGVVLLLQVIAGLVNV